MATRPPATPDQIREILDRWCTMPGQVYFVADVADVVDRIKKSLRTTRERANRWFWDAIPHLDDTYLILVGAGSPHGYLDLSRSTTTENHVEGLVPGRTVKLVGQTWNTSDLHELAWNSGGLLVDRTKRPLNMREKFVLIHRDPLTQAVERAVKARTQREAKEKQRHTQAQAVIEARLGEHLSYVRGLIATMPNPDEAEWRAVDGLREGRPYDLTSVYLTLMTPDNIARFADVLRAAGITPLDTP